jgi:hypothetical protein
MLRESQVDPALNRLSAHFGSHLVIRPPASASELAELEHIVGALPRELTIYLSTCNGLRVSGHAADAELHLWNTRAMVASILAAPGPGVPQGFVPLHGDPVGERDWLVVGAGPVEGSVVAWDPWVPGAELLASGFGSYLDCWSRYMTEHFDSAGAPVRLKEDRPAFDARYTVLHDEGLATLSGQIGVQEWLEGFQQAVACGDDFE